MVRKALPCAPYVLTVLSVNLLTESGLGTFADFQN